MACEFYQNTYVKQVMTIFNMRVNINMLTDGNDELLCGLPQTRQQQKNICRFSNKRNAFSANGLAVVCGITALGICFVKLSTTARLFPGNFRGINPSINRASSSIYLSWEISGIPQMQLPGGASWDCLIKTIFTNLFKAKP